MLNDKREISSEPTLSPNQITEFGRYWYYCPDHNVMREVEIDYFTTDKL